MKVEVNVPVAINTQLMEYFEKPGSKHLPQAECLWN